MRLRLEGRTACAASPIRTILPRVQLGRGPSYCSHRSVEEIRDEQSRLSCWQAENVPEYTGSGPDSFAGEFQVLMQYLRTVICRVVQKEDHEHATRYLAFNLSLLRLFAEKWLDHYGVKPVT